MKIIRLDASAIKESSCLLKLKRIIIDGYKSKSNSNDMEFGSAFHKFISTYRESLAAGKCKEESYTIGYGSAKKYWNEKLPMMSVKSDKKYLDNIYLAKTCMEYYDKYMENDHDDIHTVVVNNKPLVESRFSWPCYSDEHITILLCGTMDDIGKMQGGAYIIRDYKTTSVWRVAQYLEGYRLSPQLRFYYYILKKHAEAFPESIFGEMFRKPNRVGCMIDGIFLKPPSSTTEVTEFKRSEVFFFSDEEMEEFDKCIENLVERIKSLNTTYISAKPIWTEPMREGIINGACETKFGPCQFADACGAPDDISREHILKNNFVRKEYDPSTFGL